MWWRCWACRWARSPRSTPGAATSRSSSPSTATSRFPLTLEAVTVSTSILTDRQIELTPPYRGGPVLENHDTIGLIRTKTPVEFSRVLGVLDKVTKSLEGDGHGGGPVADVLNGGAEVVNGNGARIKASLDELSRALRLSSDGGAPRPANRSPRSSRTSARCSTPPPPMTQSCESSRQPSTSSAR